MNENINNFHLVTPGCIYRTNNKKILKEILATGKFRHIKTYYSSKKWWQFWKRKKPISYEVMCIK